MALMEMEEIVKKITDRLRWAEKARDNAYVLHRNIIKNAGAAIRAVHRFEKEEAMRLISEAKEWLAEANRAVQDFREFPIAGFIHDAQKELVEACFTAAVVFRTVLPDPDDLQVTYAAYLNGISEVIGELRREILDLMRQDRGEEGEYYLEVMDDIYCIIAAIDFSDSITGGLRRSTDQARSILERTRGDFTNYIVGKRLRDSVSSCAANTAAV